MERPETAAGVVEDAVEDDLHAARVGRVEQLAQRRVAAQQRVDHLVVVRVVTVVGRRGEDGIQVQRRDAELAQVVEMLGDAQQIAAFETGTRGRRGDQS